jgi:hypothetical protein
VLLLKNAIRIGQVSRAEIPNMHAPNHLRREVEMATAAAQWRAALGCFTAPYAALRWRLMARAWAARSRACAGLTPAQKV